MTPSSDIPKGSAYGRPVWAVDGVLVLDLQFRVAVELTADHAIVRFGGELDLSSCEVCRSRLAELAAVGDEAVLLDLSRLSLIDCAGVSTLIESAQRLSARHTARFVIPPRGPIRSIFDLLRLEELIAIDNELPLAIAASHSRTRTRAEVERHPTERGRSLDATARPDSRRFPDVVAAGR